MKESVEQNSPPSLQRARLRLRRMTQTAVVAATASTAVIGVLVAREHPGTSSAETVTSRTGSSPSTTTGAGTTNTTTTTTTPTTTKTTTPTTAKTTTPTTTTKSA